MLRSQDNVTHRVVELMVLTALIEVIEASACSHSSSSQLVEALLPSRSPGDCFLSILNPI